MKKSIARISCFLLLLTLILVYVNHIFKFKDGDGIYSLTKFYELEDNTVDVLILGSSHAFEDFNTGVFWDDYGMATYVLGGAAQPMWNTYYYLKEALKTQTPELIILEGFGACRLPEDPSDGLISKNNFGLHPSADKINSIKASTPAMRQPDMFLEYPIYHARYTDLSDADFIRNHNDRQFDDWKGFGCNLETTSMESIDVTNVTDRIPLYDKVEKYYRETIELALSKNIPIVVLVSPYPGIVPDEQAMFNTAEDIAAEYGIPYVNYNLLLDEIGIDYSEDAADFAHLNYRGNQKYTHYVASYINQNFKVSDRRSDAAYASWQRNADYISQMILDQRLRESYSFDDLFEKIKNPNYWVVVDINGSCSTRDEFLSPYLNNLGIFEAGSKGIWVRKSGDWIHLSPDQNNELFLKNAYHDFDFAIKDNNNSVIIDNIEYSTVKNGINIVIYDTLTEKIVDSITIDSDNGYSISRQ